MLLTEALDSEAYLDSEHLAFLADNEDTVIPAQASQEIPSLTAFQIDGLDAFDSDCDKAGDTNMISYEQYLQETKNSVVQSTSSSTQQDELLMSVIEEMSSQVANCKKVQHKNLTVNETLTVELERYKEQVKLFEQRQKFDLNDREKYFDGQLRKVIVDRNAKESKQMEDKYLDEVIDLQKKKKALDNVVYRVEQAFWLPILQPVSVNPPVPSEPILKKEIPCELPLISLVKEILKKGQNWIKTEQKRKAWRSQKKSEAVTADRARKAEENTKRRAGNANTFKLKRKKEKKRA
uniref:Uncharacterized protein n=1 Tax=Tanacetum cinerariifolium TaxID=118510 RepID=A0A6L2K2W9_TANCI|nr:hypothetical protein [Tanacetum cinerariifolium]